MGEFFKLKLEILKPEIEHLTTWAMLLICVHFCVFLSCLYGTFSYLPIYRPYWLYSLIYFITFSRVRELEKLLPLEQYH